MQKTLEAPFIELVFPCRIFESNTYASLILQWNRHIIFLLI